MRGSVFWSVGARSAMALCLLVAVCLLDAVQRPKPPPVAEATYPRSAQGVVARRLHRQEAGTIPMPADALAAHASNLLAMPPGHTAALTAFWFAGDRESAPNVQIAASQLDRETRKWLPPRYVVERHAMAGQLGFGLRRLGNPVAWTDAAGRVHLFVVATGWGGWAAARVLHLVQRGPDSRLENLEFEPVRVLPLSWFWNTSYLVRNNPLPLKDGGMLLPVHFEIGVKHAAALRFDALGAFKGMVRLSQRKYQLQPTLLAQTPSQWTALMRDIRPEGHVTAAHTDDSGMQWADLPDLAMVNPNAATAGMSLSAGQSVLAYNSSPYSRELLDLSVSQDTLHWTAIASVAHGKLGDEFSYPAVAWADGSLWVSYTDNRRRIAWQRFAVPEPTP
jgi:predicted neuraminidase